MGIPQYYDGVPDEAPKPTALSTADVVARFGRLHLLDDLIRLRAADAVQHPILAYPKPTEDDSVSYEYFTGHDLDCMVDHAVYTLMDYGFKPPREDGATVALFTLSDLNMVVTFFALSRLGYTVMMLSPRLSATACVSLLDTVGCDTILYGQSPNIRATLGDILRLKLIACRPIIQRASVEASQDADVFMIRRNRRPELLVNRTALILHSSGSTGTPKPLYLSHKALMTHPMRGPGFTSFNSLPWYHLHGLSTALQAMYMRRTAFMWDASLPLTASTAVAVLEAARPESVQGVPYLLQLLIDNPRGLKALRACKFVTYGGAPCPDELGDKLVEEGVRFGGSFGLTEAGLVAESISRPAGDPFWNYMRFFDNIKPFIWMKPISDALYEVVYLQGHPALTASNSNDPPGSFHSRDVFTPHPTIADRWKYVSRLDDRVTLVNGEKVLPLPIEGCIKQNPLIQEAVVVGVEKAVPGLLVFRTENSQMFSDEEFLDLIWPTVEDANSRAEQFSQIARDMIVVLSADSVCPRTDKGSMIRAQVYTKYADVIEDMYTNEQTVDGTLQLDLPATEKHLIKLCHEELGFPISSPSSDFFAEGLDSLKAIHLRRLILKDFKVQDPKSISHNIVFETGNITRLAGHILAIQSGHEEETEDEVSMMPGLIEKYSVFQSHTPSPSLVTSNKSVVLTGATGSIGAHTLYKLLNDDTVSVVYCLTRRSQPEEAITNTLTQKSLSVLPHRLQKIVALTSSLEKPDLGLGPSMLAQMRQSVSLIIHSAWPVNFNLPLTSFEPHIKGLHNLINFSLSVNLPDPAVLLFCSSISTALDSSSPVDETPITDLTSALEMGYGRSKLIGEKLISNARKSGARTYSLRIGQVSGHSKKGLWNDSEAIPLMIRSALTLHALPALDMTCSWLPVDKLACSILELAKACSINSLDSHWDDTTPTDDDSIYNLCNSRVFTWSSLLSTLKQSGFAFKTVPFHTWLQLLRESEARGEEEINPAVKLTSHYEAMYSGDAPEQVKFLTEKAERDSMTLRNGRLRIIQDGILARYAQDWLRRWKSA
ncbi:acetyl-CoA synthetase-like protein [Aspergillus sclerotioniger CBS 115572]|uniref:Acetyl-CoA synthetase-like protein n=1 Tax=Aspergillus sclerotioniger CBS 115572 TaxID=1450535 RepID=A0A317WTB6_9EURO|nr:acetyl-CoA synthetase-like protein [Aspergillus sclerotioniger CBS 115572]PWY89644.1 acetyl-CoA synthetase-like protein [Aspergillus sclerotioniger CBS 115572]